MSYGFPSILHWCFTMPFPSRQFLTYREAEEARPQLRAPVGEERGVGPEHGSNEVAVAVLVLAPVLELCEDGIFLHEHRESKARSDGCHVLHDLKY